MHVRGILVLAFAASFGLPTLASASIVQRWQSPPANYYVISLLNDFNADGHFEMLTVEPAAGGQKIGIRSCSTGALLAQTAATYQVGTTLWTTYLEDTNEIEEILFSDVATGNLVCVNYTGTSTLPVRWSFVPTPSGVPPTWVFANLEGKGLDMVFKDPAAGVYKYYVRDNSGALLTTIDQTATAPGSGWTSSLIVDDFENVGSRMDLMIDYHNTSTGQDIDYVFGSNGPQPSAPARATSVPGAVRTFGHVVRRFEFVDGAWSEAGPATAANADPHAVRLP